MNKTGLESILRVTSELGSIQDIDLLLERILLMARREVDADAGSIYVKHDEREGEGEERLLIRYAQNDTIQKTLAPGEKQIYTIFSLPIDEKSVAGYCASKMEMINIPDAYNIPQDAPYSFNSSFDVLTGYKTTSTFTFPLANREKLLGVIQVINKMDREGKPIPFTREDELVLTNFAVTATAALDKARTTRAMILRMIKMSELRDPSETGSHVSRVAGYSAEIYERWAHNHNVHGDERTKFLDILRIGAMLHDVGKVAIPDKILKKPGLLTEGEFDHMKHHTVYGAGLFSDTNSLVDSLSMEIALSHHERWDGTGYPGWVDPFTLKPLRADKNGRTLGKKGDEIPFAGRIVAIADVFDALSSKRAYKEAWEEEKVLGQMKELSGVQFDPELVDIFFDVLPSIRHTQAMHPDAAAV
ncbi:MAG: HD domain-containing protein [Treponema sp.]|nr:HD domain-containing protein [Treponema sp.]